MSTPRDLLITASEPAVGRSVEQGDLSLALAGAEAVDLIAAGAVTLADDRLVPGERSPLADPLLDRAAAALNRQAPYETVTDWLWRRGRDLTPAYLAALEADGELEEKRRRRWVVLRTTSIVPTDTPARRRAAERWAAAEPVLAGLGTAVGLRDGAPPAADPGTAAVLAAVDDAVGELAAERRRRARRREDAHAENVRRGY
ncbi:GPP34 family phosphoprotein [Streptomyces sp. NPDC088354]|uniref:GOLPH3/VPS74 family protein n=1 Tax=unclassified Streptomyces TaxID=2593676 RepID=UPI0029A55BE8|nr:GPP34 family phosphoprotein [Streptomyces sp. MI02-7b]MDX3075957.1 GPP34 family phosphoprotein [Streptomyces sp. MI02-7b]